MTQTLTRHWSIANYHELGPETRYEIIHGELFDMNASPAPDHQEYITNFTYLVVQFVRQHRLGKVFSAPFDVILSDDVIVQPDLTILLKAHLMRIQKQGLVGSPDLVVEVVSPSSLKRDLEIKRKLYAQYGIPEYWIVFPEQRAVEVLTLQEGSYEVFAFAALEDPESPPYVESKLLNGFQAELKEIFNPDL